MSNLDYLKLCPNYYTDWEEGCCMENCTFNDLNECPIHYVKSLLEEKDKEIESLKEIKAQELAKYLKDALPQYLSKDKTDFAVAELEKVKEKLRQNITITAPANELKKLTDYLIGVDDYIDQQIRELKELK